MERESNVDGFFMNRRDFLKKSSVLGAAGLTLGTGVPKAKAAGPNDQIGVAVIGTGAQGTVLLNSLKNIPGLKFHALCDIWE